MRISTFIFKRALRALPADFRGRYAEEMQVLFEDRLRNIDAAPTRAAIVCAECANVLLISLRLHLGRYPLQAPALVTLALALAFIRPPAGDAPVFMVNAPVDSVDFVASDPAGEFTLHVRHGRAVRATIDRQQLSRKHLVQAGDSIRVLNPKGRVLFAVAYDRDAATIEWQARPATCRGRALSCGVEQ